VTTEPTDPDKCRNTQILWRVFLPILISAVLVQALVPLIRIATTYKTLDHGFPVAYVGIISGAFALLPIFLAVVIGRMNDRGHDGLAMIVGSAILTLAVLGLWQVEASFISLFAFTSLLGFGQMFVISASQMIATRSAGPEARDSALGNFMVATSLGQVIGPAILSAVSTDPGASHSDSLLKICFWGFTWPHRHCRRDPVCPSAIKVHRRH
jgi:MFS family permease